MTQPPFPPQNGGPYQPPGPPQPGGPSWQGAPPPYGNPPQPPYPPQQPQQQWHPQQQWQPTVPPVAPQPPKKSRGPVIAAIVAAVATVVIIAVGMTLLSPKSGTPRGGGEPAATATPSAVTSAPSSPNGPNAGQYHRNSQFAGDKAGGWDCGAPCRIADGRLYLSAETEAPDNAVGMWLTPIGGWAISGVQQSQVVMENVSFSGTSKESYVGVICAGRRGQDDLSAAYEAWVSGDGTISFMRLLNGQWEQFGDPAKHRGDAVNPGEITFRCEHDGTALRVTVRTNGAEAVQTFPDVAESGATMVSFGGFGDPGTRVGVSMTGVRYDAVTSR